MSIEKKRFAKKLTDFHLRLQVEKGRTIGVFELAAMIGVSGPQVSRWLTTTQNSLPGGGNAIKMVNYFMQYFGGEALELYDAMGWERPSSAQALDSSSSKEKEGLRGSSK